MEYDSSKDTLLHIKRVNELLIAFAIEVLERAKKHDQSKLEAPEKEYFDLYTTELAKFEYGSAEYKESLAKLKPALEHHYARNTHHPEHWRNGISGMDLFDLVEMFCDWKAASERQLNGNIEKSIETNTHRFELSGQIVNILKNSTKIFNGS